MKPLRRTFSVLTCALLLHAANVVLYDNISQSVESGNFDDVAELGPLGASFSTGNAPATLTDVKLKLQSDTPGQVTAPRHPHRPSAVKSQTRTRAAAKPRGVLTGTGSITVSLYSNSGDSIGSPIATIGTLNDSALTAVPQVYDFPVGSNISLAANTRYWIVVSTSNGSVAAWDYASTSAGTGVANEFYYTDGGSSPNDDVPYIMQVTANAAAVSPSTTPAPPTLILMIAALGVMGFYLLRRKYAA